MDSAKQSEGTAEEVGRHHAALALQARSGPGPDSLVTGGEPVVRLVEAARRGKGGRNQQLVLAALCDLLARGDSLDGLCILSGGTDGEDGPTDAAGAFIDAAVVARMLALRLDPADYLARNDAYTFFAATGGLLQTGPTHTNACDVRVIVASRT
jgi:hydroxypyruvate reductase